MFIGSLFIFLFTEIFGVEEKIYSDFISSLNLTLGVKFSPLLLIFVVLLSASLEFDELELLFYSLFYADFNDIWKNLDVIFY